MAEVNDPTTSSNKNTHIVTPWEVSGQIDYNLLLEEFGTELITQELLDRFVRITGRPMHPFLRRGIFFSHRALDKFLDAFEAGEPVFLYTGRGPTSEAMHLGHMIPFLFTLELQRCFKCPLVVQMADDEKFYFKDLEFEEVYKLGFENAKDIIACGFDPEKTFIFSNRDYRLKTREFEEFVSTMKKRVSVKTVSKIFGFEDTANVGQIDWPFYQSAAAFSKAFPHIFNGKPAHCLVAYAIDQDPYFRMARDIASDMNLIKPYAMMCKFIPPLTGASGKMSSSTKAVSTIYMTDSPESVKKTVFKHAFSGGRDTAAEHRQFGCDPNNDMSYQYLRHFEFDDDKLQDTYQRFKSGEMLSGEVKQILVNKLVEMLTTHNSVRSSLTTEDVQEYYKYKPMELPKPVTREKTEEETKLYELLDSLNIAYITKYHKLITTVEQGKDIAPTLQGTVCKNLFLKGRTKDKQEKYILCIISMKSTLPIKVLPKLLNVDKVNFASNEDLDNVLHVPSGCVTVFSLMYNANVTVVIEQQLLKSEYLCFHPMRNDASTSIRTEDVQKFISNFTTDVLTIKCN
jgi:tryptophanyl-tRNA synthetase